MRGKYIFKEENTPLKLNNFINTGGRFMKGLFLHFKSKGECSSCKPFPYNQIIQDEKNISDSRGFLFIIHYQLFIIAVGAM
jgi:hypothetical protein